MDQHSESTYSNETPNRWTNLSTLLENSGPQSECEQILTYSFIIWSIGLNMPKHVVIEYVAKPGNLNVRT